MGQAKKKRECPAIGRAITASDCGMNRQSKYACPESCPFNPFSQENYDQMLEICDEMEKSLMRHFYQFPAFREKMDALLELDRKKQDAELFESSLISLLQGETYRDGMTIMDFWEHTEGDELKNDLRVMLGCKRQMRLTLIETHEVNDGWLTAVDLLNPETGTIKIVDKKLSDRVRRYNVLLVYLFPTPHFYRVFGSVYFVENGSLHRSIEEEFAIITQHLGYRPGDHSIKWFLQKALRIKQAFDSLKQSRLKAKWEATDAGVYEFLYRIKTDPGKCKQRLLQNDAVEEILDDSDKEDHVLCDLEWFAPSLTPGITSFPKDEEILWGNIRITKDKKLRLQAFSRNKSEWLSEAVNDLIGEILELESKVEQDHSKQYADRIIIKHPEWVPAQLLDHEQGFSMDTRRVALDPDADGKTIPVGNPLEEYYRSFLHEANQALDGKTPMEASTDLFLRPKLCRLIKDIVQSIDAKNREKGEAIEIDWLFEELNLQDIYHPAPKQTFFDEPESAESDIDQETVEYWAQKFQKASITANPVHFRKKLMEARSHGMGALLDSILDLFEYETLSDKARLVELACLTLWRTMVSDGSQLEFEMEAIEEELDTLYDLLDNTNDASELPGHCEEPELFIISLQLFDTLLDESGLSSDESFSVEILVIGLLIINSIALAMDDGSDYPLFIPR